MHLLYNLGIRFYGLFLRLASLFNPKARLWVQGRRGWRSDLKKVEGNIKSGFWFHCASLGEFEQGRPLMEALKDKYPKTPLIITFFSPSGFEVCNKYTLADYVCYLPLDTPENAHFFVQHLKPKAVFFVKYEFWTNFLKQVKKNKSPLYLISGNFRKDQRFFRKKDSFFNEALKCFSHFFVQNQSSAELLSSIGLKNVSVCGDTRYDRVWQNAQCIQENQVLKDFINGEKVLILGSTWPIDHALILPLINENKIKEKVIIAPHEVDSKTMKEIEGALSVPVFRYSHNEEYASLSHKRVLILDGIGMLAKFYSTANSVYIGGAFGKGLHNILEPAIFGLPVLFGPNFEKFPEAQEFIDLEIGFSINNADEFLNRLSHINTNYEQIKSVTLNYMDNKRGATQIILKKLSRDLK